MGWHSSQLDDPARREAILRALRGESVEALKREYGLKSRTQLYREIERAKRHPAKDLAQARIEVAFWQEVSRVIRDDPGNTRDS